MMQAIHFYHPVIYKWNCLNRQKVHTRAASPYLLPRVPQVASCHAAKRTMVGSPGAPLRDGARVVSPDFASSGPTALDCSSGPFAPAAAPFSDWSTGLDAVMRGLAQKFGQHCFPHFLPVRAVPLYHKNRRKHKYRAIRGGLHWNAATSVMRSPSATGSS